MPEFLLIEVEGLPVVLNLSLVTAACRQKNGDLNIRVSDGGGCLDITGDMANRVWKTFMNMSREPHRG